jgi:hypothetical protein
VRFLHEWLVSLAVIGLLATSSLALYYRSQAANFQREWRDATALREKPEADDRAPAPPPVVKEVRFTAAPRKDSEETVRLRARIRELEQQLVELAELAPAPVMTASVRSLEAEPGRRRRPDRMEELRGADPGRYEEMERRRQEMMQNVQSAWGAKADYFRNRDTSRMSETELAEYNRMQALLSDTWELNQRLQSGL